MWKTKKKRATNVRKEGNKDFRNQHKTDQKKVEEEKISNPPKYNKKNFFYSPLMC
jgi:hypothetical protein